MYVEWKKSNIYIQCWRMIARYLLSVVYNCEH
jgi:hypothetical protein